MTDLKGNLHRKKLALPRGPYILVAMPNVDRAAAYCAASDTPAFETILVRDGEDARREMARRGSPTLLILDLSLPKVDGFELLRELRERTSPAEAGAIVVSGHSAVRAAARRLAESLGISRVLPFDLDRPALREAIEATISGVNAARSPAALTEARQGAVDGVEGAMDVAVLAASRRFRTAITVAYVKVGQQEHVRGAFALTEMGGTLSVPHSLAFLRQIAAGSDPLIVPSVANYPALQEIAPGGMPLVRGFAAVPLAGLAGQPDVIGVLCVIDTKPLQMGATDLDTLEALGRDLQRGLGVLAVTPVFSPSPGTDAQVVDVDSLERLASADPLTGLANRRGGEKDIAAEISRARRQSTPLSCVLLDLDHFKDVNDTFGHQAGDYVLREISALLRRTVRAYDILVRWGGEEFLVVLPGVEQEQALKLAERIRQAIEALPLAGIGSITTSIGVSALGPDYSFDAMFATADRRLYSAKASGRNTVA